MIETHDIPIHVVFLVVQLVSKGQAMIFCRFVLPKLLDDDPSEVMVLRSPPIL